jgi:hypothetical protein
VDLCEAIKISPRAFRICFVGFFFFFFFANSVNFRICNYFNRKFVRNCALSIVFDKNYVMLGLNVSFVSHTKKKHFRFDMLYRIMLKLNVLHLVQLIFSRASFSLIILRVGVKLSKGTGEQLKLF